LKCNNCGTFCFLDASIGAIQLDRSKRYDREQTQQICSEHTRKEKYDMGKNTWFKLGGAALLGLTVLGLAVPSGQTATTVTLTAVVQNQQCQGGDFVNVTLSATLNPPQQNVQFQWDFNNDGIFETPLSPNPTVNHLYPDEINVTAVVRVVKGRRSATDPVTFRTLRCGG
jgi:hypothetical protein